MLVKMLLIVSMNNFDEGTDYKEISRDEAEKLSSSFLDNLTRPSSTW